MYTTLLKYTRKRIQPQPLVFCKWNCPTSGPLIGHPPPRFDEVDWDLADGLGQMDIAANGAGGSLGHVTPRTPVNKTHNYRRCIQYLDLLLETQNPEEKDDYEAIVNRMAACNSRNFRSTVQWLRGPQILEMTIGGTFDVLCKCWSKDILLSATSAGFLSKE